MSNDTLGKNESRRIEFKRELTSDLDLDLEMVEQLGTGVSRIAAYYGTECFKFTENFTRITLPAAVFPKQRGNEGKGWGESEGKGFQRIRLKLLSSCHSTRK